MVKFQAIVFLAAVSLVAGATVADLPKPSFARTVLKVSRSLPGETEELKVRTSEGSLATLIVKRREKTVDEARPVQFPTTDRRNQSAEAGQKIGNASPQGERINGSETQRREDVRKLEEAQIEQIRAKLSDFEEGSEKSANGSGKIAASEKERAVSEKNIDYGNWTPLGIDGRFLNSEEPTTEEYHSWKPLRSDLKTGTEERTNYARFGFPNNGLLLPRSFPDRAQRNFESSEDEKSGRTAFLPHQIRSSRTNIGANLLKNRDAKNVPAEVVIRSEINVKPAPKRSPMSIDRDGTPVIHGKRVPDEPIDKIQTWRNARVINNKLIHDGSAGVGLESAPNFYPDDNSADRQRFERFFKNVNRRYGRDFDEEGRNVFFEWDPKNYKNEALKADVYEPRGENYRANVHKRMLHPDNVATYPNSQLYMPESQKIVPVALKQGARAPVLQYAHPELGVQPAKIVKNEKRRPDNFPENQHSFTEQRQKKKYVLNDKTIVDSYTTKNYYPNQHFYGLKRPSDAPFWVKISENLKNQFSNGVEKVSQFTRPVIDPLVEATHKISQNLGLSKGKEAQDKIGTVASGTSILIPALGLVASGAALGIGAVAVGRYLDVDVLKRSNEGNDIELENQRALAAAGPFFNSQERREAVGEPMEAVYVLDDPKRDRARALDDGVFLVLEENDANREDHRETTPNDRLIATSRRKRSLDYLDVFKAEGSLKNLVRNKRLQRKGADSMSEIVEIDLPARKGNIEVTEFLIPKKPRPANQQENKEKSDTIIIVEDGSIPLKFLEKVASEDKLDVQRVDDEARNSVDGRNERRRRSIDGDQELEDALQNLENAEVAEVAHIDGDWTNTPCAKRIFCDAMIQRGPDAVMFMEKKMSALMGLIQPGAAVQVSSHFEEVMDAVRRHDCSNFLCPQARPGNVFF